MIYYYKEKNGLGTLKLFDALSESELEEHAYVLITEEQYNEIIASLPQFASTNLLFVQYHEELMEKKDFLSSTDYVVIKIAEGVATQQDYKDILLQRQEARVRINQLEELIEQLSI